MGREPVRIFVNGSALSVPGGTTLAAALITSGRFDFHASVEGAPRGPVCGMGTCFECVVTVDGRQWVRSCLVECVDGLEVSTHGSAP
jgi:aerobic-type carbon monoxide dehydrogenase small subunit (CoxS/CutS family)